MHLLSLSRIFVLMQFIDNVLMTQVKQIKPNAFTSILALILRIPAIFADHYSWIISKPCILLKKIAKDKVFNKLIQLACRNVRYMRKSFFTESTPLPMYKTTIAGIYFSTLARKASSIHNIQGVNWLCRRKNNISEI